MNRAGLAAGNYFSTNWPKAGAMQWVVQLAQLRLRGTFGALVIAAACLSACAVPSPNPSTSNLSPAPAAGVASLTPPAPPKAAPATPTFIQTGVASWYGKTRRWRRTASGQRLHDNELTAAHRTLPMGTIARVTNLYNGETVKVRINDRGPFVRGRVIDLSPDAATKLDMKQAGVAPVRVEVFASDQPAVQEAKSLAALLPAIGAGPPW